MGTRKVWGVKDRSFDKVFEWVPAEYGETETDPLTRGLSGDQLVKDRSFDKWGPASERQIL